MSRDADNKNLVNLWGRQTDANTSSVLEPQRSDLFLVDLTLAAGGIQSAANVKLNAQLRQFVRSVSLPEVRLKAEVFRRDSVPYNMPNWDDPVEAAKITFVVDTWEGTDRSDTADLLDAWVALTRAGRGARYGGFAGLSPQGYFTLDSNFSTTCRFDINVSLLRGNMQNIVQGLSGTTTTGQVNGAQLAAVAKYNSLLKQQAARQSNQGAATSTPAGPQGAPSATAAATLPQMEEHTKWVLRQCWCAGYKLSDLNYTESQLLTLEATFYPEAVERYTSTLNFNGAPTIPS